MLRVEKRKSPVTSAICRFPLGGIAFQSLEVQELEGSIQIDVEFTTLNGDVQTSLDSPYRK